MSLEKVLQYAKTIIKSGTKASDIVIDATVGNGNDTLFLSSLVPNGKVYGFDIQEKAINNTKELLQNHGINNVFLYQLGHEDLKTVIPREYFGKIAGAMFNLGYLPSGDKKITTKKESTIRALTDLLSILKKKGIIVIVLYYGHPGGMDEMEGIIDFVSNLNQKEYQVLSYRFINQVNYPPFLIAIEKLTEKQ